MSFMEKTYQEKPLYEAQMQETDLDFRAHLLKIKSLNPDVLAIGGQLDAIARITQQSYEVGIPKKVRRVAASAASNAPVPELAGDAAVGLTFAAAFSCKDERPVAQEFVKLVQTKYSVRCPDHDFSQAYETAQIIKLALKNAKLELTDASLKADRAAIRDALANIKNFTGLASGPINFCADATPQCRDGNRTGHPCRVHKGRQGLRHGRAAPACHSSRTSASKVQLTNSQSAATWSVAADLVCIRIDRSPQRMATL
jgi:ABC-type branched-subunit amino acid transport system substrate-binding protein